MDATGAFSGVWTPRGLQLGLSSSDNPAKSTSFAIEDNGYAAKPLLEVASSAACKPLRK